MIIECLFPRPGNGIRGIGLLTDETLVHFYIPVLLQVYEVSSEITIRYFQHLLQVIKVDLLIHQQDAHHPQADAVVKHFIQTIYRILHTLIGREYTRIRNTD